MSISEEKGGPRWDSNWFSPKKSAHTRRADYSGRSWTRADQGGNCIPRVLSFLGDHQIRRRHWSRAAKEPRSARRQLTFAAVQSDSELCFAGRCCAAIHRSSRARYC
jgi:hypothetical protein